MDTKANKFYSIKEKILELEKEIISNQDEIDRLRANQMDCFEAIDVVRSWCNHENILTSEDGEKYCSDCWKEFNDSEDFLYLDSSDIDEEIDLEKILEIVGKTNFEDILDNEELENRYTEEEFINNEQEVFNKLSLDDEKIAIKKFVQYILSK